MFTEKQVAFERLKVCNDCPFLIKPTWTCKKCGCFMKIKARIESSSCPEGKWYN